MELKKKFKDGRTIDTAESNLIFFSIVILHMHISDKLTLANPNQEQNCSLLIQNTLSISNIQLLICGPCLCFL